MAGPELCTWTEFSLTDVELLIGCSGNRERLQKVLCEKLCLDTSSKQDLILLDLYIYSFLFGMKQAFTAAQISTLLSIVKRLHLMCIGTVFDNYTEVLTYFQELIVLHSVNRPPFSISVFSPSHAKKINEYILTTYFKHYKMYKYAFTKKVHLNLSLSWSGEDVESEVAEVDNNLIETQTSPETTDHLLEKEGSSITTYNTKCCLYPSLQLPLPKRVVMVMVRRMRKR